MTLGDDKMTLQFLDLFPIRICLHLPFRANNICNLDLKRFCHVEIKYLESNLTFDYYEGRN